MAKIILPAVLKPISRRSDKSVKLTLDTRELAPDEILTVMAMEGSEMWVCLAPNENDLEVPEEPAVLEGKSKSERLRAVHFLLWKQQTARGAFLGTFEMFRDDRMEKIINIEKGKLEDK